MRKMIINILKEGEGASSVNSFIFVDNRGERVISSLYKYLVQ